MVEQAVQTVPLAGAAQKRGKTPTQPQGKQPARPTQRSGRAGSLVQKENVPASKLTLVPNGKNPTFSFSYNSSIFFVI